MITSNGRWMHLWFGHVRNDEKFSKPVPICTIQVLVKSSAHVGKRWRTKRNNRSTKNNHVWVKFTWKSIPTTDIDHDRNERVLLMGKRFVGMLKLDIRRFPREWLFLVVRSEYKQMLKQRKTDSFDEQLSPDQSSYLSMSDQNRRNTFHWIWSFQIMMNVVPMTVLLLQKNFFLLTNQCDDRKENKNKKLRDGA